MILSLVKTCLIAASIFSIVMSETLDITVPDEYYATGSIMSSNGGASWEYDGEGDVGYARPAIHAGFMFVWEYRGFAWFDLSELPEGAVVLDVELNVFCTQYSLDPSLTVNISFMNSLPEPGSASATLVGNSMTSFYFEDWDVMQSEGFHSVILSENAVTDLNTALSGPGWWGIGFIGENEGEMPDGSIGGFNDFNPPFITVTYTTNTLAVPVNLVGVAGNQTAVLSWEEPPNPNGLFLGYSVYRDNTLLTQMDLATTEYMDSGIENFQAYTYHVTAIYDEGESLPSNTATVTPMPFPGDVNQDNSLNVLDILNIVNFILGINTPSDNEFLLADYNQDSSLTILDVIQVINCIMNGCWE